MQPAILPARPDLASRYLLVVAGLMSTAYGLQMLVDFGRPQIDPDAPAVGPLGYVWPAMPKVQFWFTVAAWVVALAVGAVKLARRGRRPAGVHREPWRLRLLVAAVLLLPFAAYPIATAFGHPVTLLVCLPTTLLAFWLVQRTQLYRRVPLALLWAVFGWGALVGAGFGAAMNTWVLEYSVAYLSGGDFLQVLHRVHLAAFVGASVSEELGKGAGVALAYLLFRRYFDGVVSGIVLGAAAGLGFNLVESVEYLTAFNGVGADFQSWLRQSVGILLAHTAYSALVGAGFGAARQLADPRWRRAAIGGGFAAAAGAHFANDALLDWYARAHGGWFTVGRSVDILVVQPLLLAVVPGLCVVVCVLLLRRGLRGQRAGLAAALDDEVASGSGAVTGAELPLLLDPGRRLLLGMTVPRRSRWRAQRTLRRLQAAQFELGMLLWHRARGVAGDAVPDEDALRALVARRRAELAATGAGPAVADHAVASPAVVPVDPSVEPPDDPHAGVRATPHVPAARPPSDPLAVDQPVVQPPARPSEATA